MNNKEYLSELFKKVNIEISQEKIEKIEVFKQLLLEWNEKINLTAITEEKEFYTKHIIDSTVPINYIEKNSKVIDVGTGAGFPGIPIKIMRDDVDITLIDSVGKKINYLLEVINKINLKKITAIHTRAEDYAAKTRESFDYAVSRAVANMSTLSEYLLPFVKVGGKVICLKGPNIQDELNKANKAIKVLGGEIEDVIEYEIPDTELKYNLVIIKKKSKTPNRYPRKAGKPSSEPII